MMWPFFGKVRVVSTNWMLAAPSGVSRSDSGLPRISWGFSPSPSQRSASTVGPGYAEVVVYPGMIQLFSGGLSAVEALM
eukprot:SAG22_NODE_271_length_13227_cov_34.282983_8_plen_79_part_00